MKKSIAISVSVSITASTFADYVFSISIYIQQDAMLHYLFYLETALHVSGGTSTHHQEHM